MSKTLLYPMTVSAKVVKQETKVPALAGKPFNRDTVLEAGVHLQWSLPDALTASKMLDDDSKRNLIFPGVPDLWLVIRFNPGASSATPLAKRTWAAWVVDSIAQKVSPLAQWAPPADRDPKMVHTFAGLLPNASGVKHSGWGLWDTAAHGGRTFDPLMAAYYPECRRRFGFYDSLKDLAGNAKGNASYLVVGWFWNDQHDPLSASATPSKVLQQWQTAQSVSPRALADIVTSVSALPQNAPVWDVAVAMKDVALPPAAKISANLRIAQREGSLQLRARQQETMKAAFPAPAASAPIAGAVGSLPSWVEVSAAAPVLRYFPKATVCHGAVVSVPLGGSSTAPVPITNDNIKLYENVKRAMADIAAKTGAPDQVNAVEMLLANLDSQKYSTGGILDMPGAAHAYTFQSVPGKAKRYARIDLEARPAVSARPSYFSLAKSDFLEARNSAGYWPLMQVRSASIKQESRLALLSANVAIRQPAKPTEPHGPSQAEINAWTADVRAAFAKAIAATSAAGNDIDARMIRVQDSRSKAQSRSLAPLADGGGSESAGWWIDINDDGALAQLLVSAGGARISMPSADNVFEMPGPRWYRPWSPQIVLTNIGRSYKFGLDTRFRPDNKVLTRVSGDTLTSLTVAKRSPVLGKDLIENPQSLAVPGLPGEVLTLVQETLLLDTESSSLMASLSGGSAQEQAAAKKDFTNAIQGVWLSRDSRFTASLDSVLLDGDQPSAVALTPWQDPIDPVFVDSNYSHPHSPAPAWTLAPSDVELTPLSPAASVPAAGQVEVFDERSLVTASMVSVLQSALVTRAMLDPQGKPVPAQKVDKSLQADSFTKMDVVSAPLTKFDAQLYERGYRVRSGALRLNRLEVIDLFGLPRLWNSGIAPESPQGQSSQSFWVALPPRLPYWSRFTFRLMSAADTGTEATSTDSPVCGLLLPDFLEHALEVFDGEGFGIGQLTTDRPIHGQTNGSTLQVKFTPHPWLPTLPDSLDHLANPTLRALVQGLIAQPLVVPAGTVQWAETGLSAMLRTIDTIRGTFDAAAKTADRKVSLIGEPILVMAARLQFTGTSATDTAELSGDPAPLGAPPELPSFPVRIGDATRPDDMVLGLFMPSATPENSRFAPVTKEAAQKALVNGLATGFGNGTQEVTHPFVKDQEALVVLPANAPVDVVVLADARGGLYATMGALPRKKITIPKDFVDSALRQLEPSFFTGPILTTVQFDSEKALLPPPDIAGYQAEFLYQKPVTGEWSHSDVPAAPPLSDLPKDRVLLTQGWLRMVPDKKP